MRFLNYFALAAGVTAASDFNPGAYFISKTIIIPHDEKKHRGGEDAAATDETILVVADGVGGWANHGVNPGIYSRALV
jgi:protein phosphatase PTC7